MNSEPLASMIAHSTSQSDLKNFDSSLDQSMVCHRLMSQEICEEDIKDESPHIYEYTEEEYKDTQLESTSFVCHQLPNTDNSIEYEDTSISMASHEVKEPEVEDLDTNSIPTMSSHQIDVVEGYVIDYTGNIYQALIHILENDN